MQALKQLILAGISGMTVAISLCVRADSLSVKMLQSEKWWGLCNAFGREMPFAEKTDFKCDLRKDNYGHQSLSFLCSDKGRAIWCAEPVGVKIAGGEIALESDKGEIIRRTNGSMIALETGTAFAYAINNLQDRGRFFIEPQTEVYAGQVVGEHIHENDLVINVTKNKQLTNMRASGSDEKVRIIPATLLSLEEALEYIKEDEYVEVTPKSMRMRKIILDHLERKRAGRE